MSKNFKLWRASTTILDKACSEIYKIKQTRFFYWFFFSWFLQYFFKKTLKLGFRLTSWVFAIKSNSIWSAPVVFPKICLLEKGLSPAFCDFFVTFYIIISHIFPENFIEISQVVQKIWRFFQSILSVFIDFSDFLTFPCYRETIDVSI